jgi:hypothetical protein
MIGIKVEKALHRVIIIVVLIIISITALWAYETNAGGFRDLVVRIRKSLEKDSR